MIGMAYRPKPDSAVPVKIWHFRRVNVLHGLAASALFGVLAACQSDLAQSPASESTATHTIETHHVARPSDRPLFSALAERILALHNHERVQVGVPPLTWDDRLALNAAAWAEQIGDSGMLEHSGAEDQGENLWMGTASRYPVEAMIETWANERRDFRPGRFPDVSQSGDWARVGHYTQMIWRDTRAVGCAIHNGRHWDVLVCRYMPAGNVMGLSVP